MAVKIRFTRVGKKHAPTYRIVAIDSKKKRDGEYIENLGTYNPLTKEIVQWHADRIAYWESKGAIVTDSVKRLQKIKNKQASSKPAFVEIIEQTEEIIIPKKVAKKASAKKAA